MEFILVIAMEQVVFVNPNISLSINLPERVKVQLTNQRLEAVVSKVLWQGFRFETVQIRSNDERVSRRCPLGRILQEMGDEEGLVKR
jgi:hypothetical protein